VLSGDALADRQVFSTNVLDQVVPNLQFGDNAALAGNNHSSQVFIRGIGQTDPTSTVDPGVGLYIDDVYMGTAVGGTMELRDVDSIQVLRGPQGTLFGRNATVGALSVKTHAPSFGGFSARVAGQIGKYGEHQVEGMVNVPVNDQFAVRAAVLATETDGFVKNRKDGKTYGAKETGEGRLSAKWAPTDDLTWTVRADYAHTSGDGVALNQVDTSTASAAQIAAYTARLGGNPTTLSYPPSFTANQRYANLNLSDIQWGLASDINWQFAGGYTLRMINAYRDWHNQQSDGDVVFTTLDLLTRDASFDSEAQSHELQLISPKDELLGGRLDYVAGLYQFQEDYHVGEIFGLGANFCGLVQAPLRPACAASGNKASATDLDFNQDAKNLAAYAQADVGITDTIDLVLGALSPGTASAKL